MKKIRLFWCLCLLATTLSACTSSSTVEGNTMTVTDARGEVVIPQEPKRIVDISGNSDILSILGYQVIGTANSDAYDYTKLPSYLNETLQDAVIVGYSMQDTMDVEAILNLTPDLIIMSTHQEKMYEQLSQIAPTLMIQLEALDWKDDIRTMAKVFQKEEIADTWIQAYEDKAQAVGKAIKEAYGADTSYLSMLASAGQFFIFTQAGFGDVLYNDLGLQRPEHMPLQTDISLPVVSYEGLAQINADTLFLITTEEMKRELDGNAIWNQLDAVKKNHVITLESSPYFNQGYSPIGREQLLDEIKGMLDETL